MGSVVDIQKRSKKTKKEGGAADEPPPPARPERDHALEHMEGLIEGALGYLDKIVARCVYLDGEHVRERVISHDPKERAGFSLAAAELNNTLDALRWELQEYARKRVPRSDAKETQ